MAKPKVLDYTSVAKDAAALWGREGADLVFANLIGETSLADAALPMIEPTRQIFVDIQPLDSNWAGLRGYMRLSDLMPCYILDSNSGVPEILERIEGAGLHESAHRAHYQHMRQNRLKLNSWFGFALREGIAQYAVDSIEDQIFGVTDRYQVDESDIAINTLIDLLYNDNLKRDSSHNYNEFMFESVGTIGNKGYHAAIYAVSLFAAARRCNVETLMRTPVETYQEFVEYEL